MKNIYITAITLIGLLVVSCKTETKAKKNVVKYIEFPSSESSSVPFLFSNEDKILLSWSERQDSSKVKTLRYAELVDGKWAKTSDIISSENLLINWADFSVIAENKGNIASNVLIPTKSKGFTYDIKLNHLNSKSSEWKKDIPLHTDGVLAEHGFVSMIPYKENSFFVTWLDGRYTATKGGAMSVRAAEVSPDGTIINEVELDAKVCDCCGTTASITNNGPVVIYRDRTDDEIRDFYITRLVDGNWTGQTHTIKECLSIIM
ncbi:MAG: hypothetical protein HRT66_02200 [Flavobacteriaceae bacterium]|nr:hypothetical protein [Flavobacteriaceae bacterium]